MKTVEESILLVNQKIHELLEEDPVGNLDKIKELSRVIQRMHRAK
jgi:hypothetical protein